MVSEPMVMAIFGTCALRVVKGGYSALGEARLKALREEIEALREEIEALSDDEREDGEGDDVVEIKDEREMELEKNNAALKEEKKIKAVVGEANDNDAADDVEEGEGEDANVKDDDDEDEEEEEEIGEEENEGDRGSGSARGLSKSTPKNGGDASNAALEEVDEEEIDPAEEDDEENNEEKDEEMVGQEREIRCGRSCQAIWCKARVQVKALESEEKSKKAMNDQTTILNDVLEEAKQETFTGRKHPVTSCNRRIASNKRSRESVNNEGLWATKNVCGSQSRLAEQLWQMQLDAE